jgi:hypothetical protein
MVLPMRSNNSIFRTSFSTLTQAMGIGWGGTRMLVSINLLFVFVWAELSRTSTPRFSYRSFSLEVIADSQQHLLLRSSPMYGKQLESRNHAKVL